MRHVTWHCSTAQYIVSPRPLRLRNLHRNVQVTGTSSPSFLDLNCVTTTQATKAKTKKQNKQTYIRSYVRTYVRTYVCTYALTYARTYVRTSDVRTYERTYVRTRLDSTEQKTISLGSAFLSGDFFSGEEHVLKKEATSLRLAFQAFFSGEKHVLQKY